MYQAIIFAIPVFALLIGLELFWGWRKRRNNYRLNSSIGSLSQGLLSQVVAVCTQLFQIGFYAMVYPLASHWSKGASDAFWHSVPGWIGALLLYDFCNYWVHRAGHESAVFWAAHSVHHQSQDYNLTTALRQGSGVALLGWVFFLPMAIVGISPGQFGLLGLAVTLHQFWIHTEHIGKLGWFDRVFTSPSNHRVHHAVNDEYVDRNYGALLMVWDRLFGTYAEEKAPCVYGTRKPLESWSPLQAVLGPYLALARESARTRDWRDKLRVWWKAPGWQPADVAAKFPETPFALEAVKRYDPPLTPLQQWSGAAQFALWLAATMVFLWQADGLPYGISVALLGATATGLWATGAMLGSDLRVRHAWALQIVALGLVTTLLMAWG